MRKLLFLLFMATSFFISCQQEKEITDIRVIDLEGNIGKSRKVLLSEIAESIEYVPLETTHESSLGVPTSGILIYENGLLFVYQKGNYFKIFNSAGDYLSTFNRRGNGPQEYVTLTSVVVDSCAEVISVLAHKKIIEYKTNGEYIRTIELPAVGSLNASGYFPFGKVDDNSYVLCVNIIFPTDYHDYSAIVIDSSSRVIHKILYTQKARAFMKKIAHVHLMFDSPITPILFTYKNSVRVINETDETILAVSENGKIDTAFILNYGKYSMTNFPELYSTRYVDAPCVKLFQGIFESSSFLFLSFRTGKLPIKHREITNRYGETVSLAASRAYFNKKTGRFSFVEPIGLNEFGIIDDLEGGPSFWPVYISQDDYMVNYIDAIKFIEYAESNDVSENLKKVAENLRETDNLLMVRVKLKK